MSETITQRMSTDTLKTFNELKATVASTMSFDEFLNVLMVSYKTGKMAQEGKA